VEIYLEHLKGEREGALDRFTADFIRVGRDAQFELCFEDLGVSYEHAELRRRDDGEIWVIDRGSTNGTYVNEERAHNARLKDGDVVRFGKKGPVVKFRTSEADPLLSSRAKAPPRPASSDDPKKAPTPKQRVTARYQALELDPLGIQQLAEPPPPASGTVLVPSERPATTTGQRSMAVPLALAFALLASTGITVALYVELERTEEASKKKEVSARDREALLDRERLALEKRLNEEKVADQATISEARLRAEKLEAELDRERRESRTLERKSRDKVEELERKLARANGELAALSQRAATTGPWGILEKRLTKSVVLIAVQIQAKRADGARIPMQFLGTGFFLNKDGLIATNKHVVEPWKFRQLAQQLAQDKLDLDQETYNCMVWVGGTRFQTADKRLDLSTGYSTKNGTLERVKTAPDRWVTLSMPGDNGPRLMKIHDEMSNEDLALLKAHGGPFEPIPMRRSNDGAVDKLDGVMVLGFPAGTQILERGVADPSAANGTVRKIEDTIYYSAPTVVGNSGGPLLDSEGRAIGVVTRIVSGPVVGTETLGSALKIQYVIDLAEGGSW
jgi:S1-C subfamily serine protease/pSer/pThr/pTyr-binding forkhead associated (FHA) protein